MLRSTSDANDTSDFLSKKVVTQAAPFQTKYSKSNKSGARAPSVSAHSTKRKLIRPEPAVVEAFDRFYLAFPRHVAKQKALEAWLKLSPDAELVSVIMQATARYAMEVENTESRYVSHPATWLNGKRWEDETLSTGGETEEELKRRRQEMFINA
jgi:hypothetical protein